MDVDEFDGEPVTGFRTGDTLPGQVRAWERMGVGYRCETWLAWSPRLWAPVVVKFPRPHQLDHPRARKTLCRETAALAGNPHPALPRLYADGTADAVPHVVLEYVDGNALDDEIGEHGPMTAIDAAMLGWQVLAALRTVHDRGIAHVDLKPANVMLRDGRPMLIDFGSARRIGAPQPHDGLIGSPGYAAPELEAGEPIAAAMDVFGLGVTLHEAMTDDWCFDPDRPAAQRRQPPPLPDSPVADLVLRMLDPDPARRPDVDAVLGELGLILTAAGTPAAPEWAGRPGVTPVPAPLRPVPVPG